MERESGAFSIEGSLDGKFFRLSRFKNLFQLVKHPFQLEARCVSKKHGQSYD
jgi:hypothetical protein